MANESKLLFLAACRQLLRPVARLLLKAGITWREFADVSKFVFIDVATREFGLRGRPTNMARVALMTGIHRREVSRLRDELAASVPPVPTYLNAAQRVLSGWHQDPEYFDSGGLPRALPVNGLVPSFASLCERHGGDMPMTALLRELRKVGAVGEAPDGRLLALMRTYIQEPLDPEKVLRAGSVLEDLGDTVVFDLGAAATRRLRFERRAENDRIDIRNVPAFQDFLEQEGMAFLERIDAWLSHHEVPPAEVTNRTLVRLGAGLFHIENLQRKEDSR